MITFQINYLRLCGENPHSKPNYRRVDMGVSCDGQFAAEESLDRVRDSKEGYLSCVTTLQQDNVPQAYADGAIGKWSDQPESVDFTVDILKQYHLPFRVRLLACSNFTMTITLLHVPHLFRLWDYVRMRSSDSVVHPLFVNVLPIVSFSCQYLQIPEIFKCCFQTKHLTASVGKLMALTYAFGCWRVNLQFFLAQSYLPKINVWCGLMRTWTATNPLFSFL